MPKFIIHGPRDTPSMEVDAATLFHARQAAYSRAQRDGYVEPEDLCECAAEPWTWDRAYDLNLLPYEGLPIYETNIIERSW